MGVFEKVRAFYKSFSGIKGVTGYSVKNLPIFFFEVKKTERPRVLVQCALHAREFITAMFCLKEIERFALNGAVGRAIFIPCVNPDGVKIAETVDPLYKANANGVDLNVNFDARWGTGVKNVKVAGAENYIGEHPFSEPESVALKNFTLFFRPDMTVSYHTKGEEIYYRFFQTGERLFKDKYLAELVSLHTGYRIKDVLGSAGGYKDWCVERLKISAVTIEAGNDGFSHPLNTKKALKDICDKNLGITAKLTEGLIEYGKKVYGTRDKGSEKG